MNSERDQNSCKQEELEITEEEANNKSNNQQRSCTYILLEGTHTTETQTDGDEIPSIEQHQSSSDYNEQNSLKTIQFKKQFADYYAFNNSNVVEQRPTTSKTQPVTLADDFDSQEIHSQTTRPVEELIREMNENIQAIVELFEHVKRTRNNLVYESQQLNNYSMNACQSPINLDMEAKMRIGNLKDSQAPDQRRVCNNLTVTNFTELNDEIESNRVLCAELTNTNSNIAIMPVTMYESFCSNTTILAPCEYTHHTLHIESASSPTSSIMYRPPLCVRFWSIFTDCFTAIYLCLQVNMDFIFCLGFFVAFVVSASFLTAFFYRTLNFDQQNQQRSESTRMRNR